ncbi:MAG TPA: flagellar biosynthesis anti-sigma factor FlgM [Acidocella sp.]|nr:flagellar biosynthesis anti-sigma factor FlgM [Acidocella sp.]
MSSAIGTLGPANGSAYATQTSAGAASSAAGPTAMPVSETDAVTLSDSAAGAASLVEAAQGSEGIDEEAVAQIKGALASGSYSVAPEDLAKAIATVLRGAR